VSGAFNLGGEAKLGQLHLRAKHHQAEPSTRTVLVVGACCFAYASSGHGQLEVLSHSRSKSDFRFVGKLSQLQCYASLVGGPLVPFLLRSGNRQHRGGPDECNGADQDLAAFQLLRHRFCSAAGERRHFRSPAYSFRPNRRANSRVASRPPIIGTPTPMRGAGTGRTANGCGRCC
jgi:hypothetical protein